MIWYREPARIIEFCKIVLSFAVAFGFELKDDQVVAVMALVGFASNELLRTRVTPIAKQETGKEDNG